MLPAAAIGRLGFRRWYERELIVGHGWLVACLLCVFALLALFEDLSYRSAGLDSLIDLVTAFAAGWIAWTTLKRYVLMLLRAQHLAERSTCKPCGAYGRYRLVGATSSSMIVCCRNCGNEWTID